MAVVPAGCTHRPQMYPTPGQAWWMGGGRRVRQGSTGPTHLPLDSIPTQFLIAGILLWENDDVGLILLYSVIYDSVASTLDLFLLLSLLYCMILFNTVRFLLFFSCSVSENSTNLSVDPVAWIKDKTGTVCPSFYPPYLSSLPQLPSNSRKRNLHWQKKWTKNLNV